MAQLPKAWEYATLQQALLGAKVEASFALLSGTAPLVASSGQTHRHRLNRGGNRQLNWALHYIALVQSRFSPEAKSYLARKREAGKSHKEAMRCLKRQLSIPPRGRFLVRQ